MLHATYEAYETACAQLDITGDTNYCAPIALSLVTNIDVCEVSDELTAAGLRKFRKGMNCRDMATFLKRRKFKVCTIHPAFKHRGVWKKYGSVGSIGKKFPKGHFLVYTKGHVAALVNGKILDWTEGRRHQVIKLVQVKPRKAAPKAAPKAASKAKRVRKSDAMLKLLQENNNQKVSSLAAQLNTSEASVRCYVSYFRTGRNNHKVVAIKIVNGCVVLG